MSAHKPATLTVPEQVYSVARVYAEVSDWKRDSGESLADWTARTLKRGKAYPRIVAYLLREERIACMDQRVGDKCICTACSARALLRSLGEVE